jgi:hypothetical protein
VTALMPLILALLGTGQSGPSDLSAADRVTALAGTWTCRSVDRETIHDTGARDGNVITVRSDVQPSHGKALTRLSRYEFKPAQGRWSVATARGTDLAATGDAAPWTGDRWVVDGHGRDGQLARIVFEVLPGGDMRRTYSFGTYAQTEETSARRAERCSPGDVPPADGACIVPNLQAATVSIAPPVDAMIPARAPERGRVNVTVSMDADSHITGTRIYSTTSALLNNVALITARNSVFRTEIRNCKPVPSEAVLSVDF